MLRFFKYTDKKEFIKLFVVRVIVILSMLLSPMLIAAAIDSAIVKDLEATTKYIVCIVFLDVFIHIFYVLEDYLFGKNDMKAYINQFSKINQAVKIYDSKKYNIDDGRIAQELGQNFEIVQPFIYKNTLRIILNTIKFIGTCIIVYFISPYLLLAFLIIIPISAFVSYKSEEKIAEFSSDHLDDMKTIKGFIISQKNLSKEERFLEKRQLPDIKTFYKTFKDNLIKKIKYESVIYNIFVYGTLNFAITLSTIISVILIIKGEMTAGSYAAVSIYISNLWDPMLDLFNIRREYVSGKPAMESYDEFLNLSKVEFLHEKVNDIEIKNYVSLGKDGQKLHKAKTFSFAKNKINLIVGDNGIGKTTLVEAILNLTSRYDGEITINGKIVDKNSNILYEDMVYIPADPIISEYGFLKEKANNSSGQKKLSQLENAILTKKSVYIFDEPTNFLDFSVKSDVINLIKNLLSDEKIVIVISHDSIFLEGNDINLIKI